LLHSSCGVRCRIALGWAASIACQAERKEEGGRVLGAAVGGQKKARRLDQFDEFGSVQQWLYLHHQSQQVDWQVEERRALSAAGEGEGQHTGRTLPDWANRMACGTEFRR
jgi:hypothetical protein